MCYAYPGPRCSYHAKANLASASKALAESKERFSALENSKSSMDAQEYEAQVSEMNSNLNSALQGYKQSAELYWETRSGRAQLGNLAQDNGVSQEHVDSVVSKLRKGEPITHEDKNPSTGNPRGAKFLNKMVSAHQSYYRKTADYHKAKEITTMIDRKNRPEYISSIETKHITGSSAGSKFTDPSIKNVNDVMSLAQQQSGSLDGDDRDKLIAQGAEPSSFLPASTGVRYLMVKTQGTQALKNTSDLDEDTTLTVTAKGRNDGKPASLSLATEVKEQPKTQFGTIIVGPKEDENRNPIENTTTLWTMHPGVPTRGIRSNDLRENGLDGGSTITVKELREKFGKDINVNTKLIN